MIFLCVPLIVLAYMCGGQINKLFRPIGVPISIGITSILVHYHPLWALLPSLLWGAILTLGYGVNSKLMKWLKNEQLVRIILGLLVSIPVALTAIILQKWIAILGVIPIVACSCIRMGKWGSIGKFEILPVDIFRGLALGLTISYALIK